MNIKKNNINMFKKAKSLLIRMTLVLALLLAPISFPIDAAGNPLTRYLGVGDTGADVINLQTYLASDVSLYPEGLITGYYGILTSRAVGRFQARYGIAQVGVVGPQTMAKINSLIGVFIGADLHAPILYNVNIAKGNTSVAISWSSTEAVTGKVYYSTNPMVLAEATGLYQEPTILSNAAVVLSYNNLAISHSVTINNLQPNTLYYYMAVSQDAAGNVSVTVPSTFTTNP